MNLTASRIARRSFLKRAGQGVGAGLLFGLIPWEDVLARATAFGIVPGTRVDAQGRPLAPMPGAEPWIGELALFPYTFEPRGFAYCAGQLLSIEQNTALFSLIGTSFGGNGQTTFALPDLRGRMIRGVGQGPGMNSVVLGETAGQESVTLLATEMPTHTHTAVPVATGRRTRTPSATSGASAVLDVPAYGTAPDGAQGLTGLGGSGVPVNNLPPYLVLSPCIALVGIFPSRP